MIMSSTYKAGRPPRERSRLRGPRVAAHRARIRNNQAPSSTDRGNEIRPT
jgi:hypothetical protein